MDKLNFYTNEIYKKVDFFCVKIKSSFFNLDNDTNEKFNLLKRNVKKEKANSPPLRKRSFQIVSVCFFLLTIKEYVVINYYYNYMVPG